MRFELQTLKNKAKVEMAIVIIANDFVNRHHEYFCFYDEWLSSLKFFGVSVKS
jgi:hypothetical protein